MKAVIELKSKELVTRCHQLAKSLIARANRVENGDGHVNGLGIVQGEALRIDILCAEISLLHDLSDLSK